MKNYPQVKKLYVAEIDERVVEVTRKFFSFAEIIERELLSKRLEIFTQSGVAFIERMVRDNGSNSLDAVIIDCTDFALDEESIAAELFSPQFYSHIHQLLKPGAGFS